MNEQEKSKLGADSVHSFLNQFGEPDEYVTILLEVLMEELFNVPPVSLLGEPEQERDQTLNNSNGTEASQFEDLQRQRSESSQNMGSETPDIDQ